jgi:hypothetical protein
MSQDKNRNKSHFFFIFAQRKLKKIRDKRRKRENNQTIKYLTHETVVVTDENRATAMF